MAGHHDRQRIAAIGGADRTHRVGVAAGLGQLLVAPGLAKRNRGQRLPHPQLERGAAWPQWQIELPAHTVKVFAQLLACSTQHRSEEQTSELQSLMRISYAVFCLKKNKIIKHYTLTTYG